MPRLSAPAKAIRAPATAPLSRARLSLVLFCYFLGVVGVITLSPFHFVVPVHYRVVSTGDWFDVVTNVLLFLPLGFLYPLTRGTDEPDPWRMFLLGCLLSGAIETTQLFEPERYSSWIDVLTNALGAAVGAALLRAVSRRIRLNRRLVGRLSLEIPLIGLIYLLVPLLVVASVSATADRLQLVALIPLGLLGARLISAVQRYHFSQDGAISTNALGVIAAGWMLLGVFPLLQSHLLIGVSLIAAVGLATWYESQPAVAEGAERRFEGDTLRGAVPYIVAYFIVVVVFPLAAGTAPWHFEMGLTGAAGDLDQQMARMMEPAASLTLLGYMIAEARGRRELRFRATIPRLALECGLVAVAIEASRGAQAGGGASGVQCLIMIAAGLLGGGIYHKQREHVRWIITERANTPVHSLAAVR